MVAFFGMPAPDADKTERITIRCTVEQRELWETLSAKDDRTLAEWIRVMIDRIARGDAIAVACTKEQREKWEQSAGHDRRSLADWMRITLDDASEQRKTDASAKRR